ncbi:hypothetical protein B0A50_07439 [Salinomyces thailandicus]|uniref:Glycosyltransferase family 32 protein n=1 Tax=Salinomyces thailandicus TaxID=706561 RepID=A0A4U0TPE7_9PEZI|nr:hypothetical protein B0A50_07439 [Salinomyces thailandica]
MINHPEIIYRYPPTTNEERGTSKQADQAPKIIHQIFLQEGRNSSLSKYNDALASCQTLHADWTHMLWTDANATAFMQQHYPAIAPHYAGYAQSIQRANILRYALLDHFGGVYLDLDVTCLQPLDDLRHLPWITPGAYPAGVNNAFILSRQHHPFLQKLLAEVPRRDMKWPMPYVENMLSTGCMYFTNRWMAYVRWLAASPGPVPEEEKVYILADQDGNTDTHMLRGKVTTPLFAHGGASSWHGWDAAVIVLVGKHYGYFSIMTGSGVLLLVALVWRLTRRNRVGERRSPLLRARHGRESMEKIDDEEKLLSGKEG